MAVDNVVLTAKFQKRNPSTNQLTDITFVNGQSSATTLTGQGATEALARANIASQLAVFAGAANAAADDVNSAIASLG